ncbi:MAG: DUF2251 domain-containing protein [Planctomycetes bacterium]|nr:DUF2251 domain-containing protein [Planctomycetota bacterium]MCB9918058.1 DUF2251 domain-containing protein [Planctomycetota bacterium]
MPLILDQVWNERPGQAAFQASTSTSEAAAVVFEDDGRTGYFYACESDEGPIFDALHIYDVEEIADRDRESEFKIGWSSSGRQAALLINGHPHAVFDFELSRGWCRSGFPDPPRDGGWSTDGHAWDEDCLASFR